MRATALLLLLVPQAAWASVPLCLELKSDRAEGAAFEKLARSEIARHPSHRLVSADCDSRLFLELFHLGTTRFLTAQVDGEIPVRYQVVSDSELERRLGDAISRVLGNDPAYLAENPEALSPAERAMHSILVRGNNSYRLALFETLARTDRGVAFAPGIALEFARGADHFQAYARAEFGGSPQSVKGSDRVLRVLAGADVGLLYELSERAATSGYAGLGAGAAFLSFAGLLDASDPASVDHAETVGAVLNLRAGVRFFRTYDFGADVFVRGTLPLFVTKGTDSLLFGEDGAYTPFVQLGLAVGF